MENYKVLQRLGKGAQGSVYLAESRIDPDGPSYVIKKIECTDENEANKAFREAMMIRELEHPYVCNYKEFFVTWDREDSAMYVCIVMDHYIHGDMSSILKQQRNNEEYFDEVTIKKWLGQIIEALIFIHKRKVIHRDLKPSNVFMKEDLSICIGDFGVATIMADCRIKTRTAVGSMNWMAPEVLDRPYDERSDVWSAGCILLEMVTCGLCDSVQMSGKLFEIKHSPSALEEVLEQLTEVYSPELLMLIRTMLRRSYDLRPSAQDLSELPYIRECLALSGSVLAEKLKKIHSEPKDGEFPTGQGIEAVVDYLGSNLNNEDAVKESMAYLVELTGPNIDGVELDEATKMLVLRAMQNFTGEMDIQLNGCKILNASVGKAVPDDLIYSTDAISAITLAMKSHPSSAELLRVAASLFVGISADEFAAVTVGKLGGLQDLLMAIRLYPDDLELCIECCNALWGLTINADNAGILTEAKGFKDVMNVFTKHLENEKLAEAAAAALLSLVIEDNNLQYLNGMECVWFLLEALQLHMKSAKVVKNVCMALAGIVEPDEESAYKVLSNKREGREVQGIKVLMEAYETHKDNAEVVESLSNVFLELIEYDEILAEMKYLNTLSTIFLEVQKRFQDEPDILMPCEATIAKMKR